MKNRARFFPIKLSRRRAFAGVAVFALTVLMGIQPLSPGVTQAAAVYSSEQTLRAGSVIADATINVGSGAYAISGSGASGAVIRNVTVNGSYDALKVGSGAQTVGLTVDGLRGFGPSHVAVFLANVTNGIFDNLVMDTSGYALYLERGNHGLTFRNVTLTSSDVWTVHAYNFESQSEPSEGLLMDGGTVNASQGAFVLSGGWSGITIRNLQVHSSSSSWPIFRLYGGVKNVLIENVEVWGGSALVDVAHPEVAPVNVTLRNVTYHGAAIISGADQAAISGLTLDNVTLAGAQSTTTTTGRSATTTLQPTTTTVAPTTTTTPAKTTTTTAPVQTTTTTLARPTTTTTVEAPTTTTLPTEPPADDVGTLVIASPVDHSSVQGNVAIRMSVTAPVTVAKVRLYVDGRLISQDYRSPYTFSWNTRLATPGSLHTLRGIAYDSWGRRIAEATETVQVVNPMTPRGHKTEAPRRETRTFSDVPADSAYSRAVAALAEAGVVSGYKDGNFWLERTTTRAQLAKMVSLSLGLADQETTTTPFRDLDDPDANLYPHKYVAALDSIGAISGTSPGQFSPYAPVTRAQLITILVRALETLDPEALVRSGHLYPSAIGDTGYEVYTRAMATAEASGLLSGIVGYGAKWDPWAPATRGETAQMLENLQRL